MHTTKITFLGAGSALSKDRLNANILLDMGISGSLLVDCGMDIKVSLRRARRSLSEINAIYLSHLHCDHAGGVEWAAWHSHFVSKSKPMLYIHPDHLKDLREHLKPTLALGGDKSRLMEMEDYFHVCEVADNKTFMIGQNRFRLVKNIHISHPIRNMFSYGLIWDRAYSYEYAELGIARSVKKVYFSSDSQGPLSSDIWTDEIRQDVLSYDLLFHDVSFIEGNSAHAGYDLLKNLSPYLKKKMWLYHYDISDGLPNVVDDGFAGFVQEGQEFVLGEE